MIIHVETSDLDSLTKAKDGLEELVESWGCQLSEIPAKSSAADDPARESGKSADPVAIVALILSIPSATLAVTDLADRMNKRRRAMKLIDKVKQITDGHTTIKVITKGGPQDLSTLTPDQLLDLPEPGESAE